MEGGKPQPHATAPPAYYGLKDQPLPYPATQERTKRKRGACCCIWTSLCSCLIFLIVAVGIATLVFWLVVRPKLPEFNVTDVRLTGLRESLQTMELNTTTSFTLDAYNPNKKMEFYFDEIDVQVTALGVVVGEGQIPPFHQGHRNRTIIQSSLNSQKLTLTTDRSQLLMAADASGVLPLYIKVNVKSRIKVASSKTDTIKVKVRCNVEIDPRKTGGSQLLNKKCTVKN